MKYKLFVSDFDFTMTDMKGEVHPKTVNAIRDYRDAGGHFVVSTGRTLRQIRDYFPGLGLDMPGVLCVTYGGSVISTVLGDKMLHSVPMQPGHCVRAARYMLEHGADVMLFAERKIYAIDYFGYIKRYVSPLATYSDLVYLRDVEELKKCLQKERILKISAACFADGYADVDGEVEREFAGELLLMRVAPFMLELVDIQSGKGNAVKYLCRHFGVSLEETVCIGDSMNDYTMLQCAGLGIAVDNAVPELKAVARMVTVSCERQAVAQIIQKAIKNQL